MKNNYIRHILVCVYSRNFFAVDYVHTSLVSFDIGVSQIFDIKCMYVLSVIRLIESIMIFYT